MDAVVARCVVPASVHIDKALLAPRKSQVAICLVYQAACSLTLEVENDIGESVALKNIVIDFEWAGNDGGFVRVHLKHIVTRLLPGGEVRCPEDLILPRVDFSCGLEGGPEDSFFGIHVDKRKLLWMIVTGSGHHSLL